MDHYKFDKKVNSRFLTKQGGHKMKTKKKTTIILTLLMAGLFLSSHKLFPQQTASQLYEKALYLEEARGELQGAIDIYNQLAENQDADQSLKAKALLHMGMCYEKLGSEKARQAYRDVINRYPEQAEEAAIARERMTSLDAYVAELNTKAEQHMKEGNELFKMWEYEDAIKEYEDAITLRPNTLLAMNAQYSIGHSLYRAGKYEDAFATFTNLVEANPESNIAPVTELMLSQVQYAMEKDNNQGAALINPDEDTFVDPETGITYTKINAFVGKNDLIRYTTGWSGISPDGRFLVFENKIIPVDGSDPFALVEKDAFRIVYSPDMQKAAFYADSAIWMVPVSPETGQSAGPPVILVKGNYKFQHPISWSPDGEKIAFSRRDKIITDNIWTISISDGELKPVSNFEGHEQSPVWSPDSKNIAFVNNRSIFLFSTESNETKMIIENGLLPVWSPDGKWLIYTIAGASNLYSMDRHKSYKIKSPDQVSDFIGFTPNGRKMLFYRPSYEEVWQFKAVSTSGGPSFSPAPNDHVYDARWSTDGKVILALSKTKNGDYIFKSIPIDGGDPLPIKIDLTNLKGDPFPVRGSPDLSKLTFWISRDDNSIDLYLAPLSIEKASTTGPARLIFEGWSGGPYSTSFSWSPDGSNLALIHEEDIWIVPLEGGSPLQITNTPEHELWPNWSPDGKMIAYLTISKDKRIAHVIPATGGISKITHNDIVTGNWGPDSKSVAILSNGEISVISLTGEKLRHIVALKDLGLDDSSSPKYSPDGKQIAFFGNSGTKSIIYLYSLEDEKFTRLAEENPDTPKYALEWSPDGKWLSYQTSEEEKIRPESTMWEVDFEEIKQKLLSRE
ncbi:MAG: hypothetical protein DRJ29_17585 [Bacteroidetes bacterium]|nr:MAG: hypothetical protein DRJ29_17585 [Bacteroidota bacterium]